MSKFYVVPEERLKEFIMQDKYESFKANHPDWDCPDIEVTEEDLKEFPSVDCIDNQTSIDPAITINNKPIHDDIFVDKDKFITHQVSLQFNEIQQHSMIQQDMFKDKQ